MPDTPLNPDALVERIAGIIDSECQSYDAAVRGSDEILYGETTDLPSCAAEKIMALIRPHLAVAQPVVNSDKASAWDEGFKAGWEEAKDPGAFVNDVWDSETPNPYRPEVK